MRKKAREVADAAREKRDEKRSKADGLAGEIASLVGAWEIDNEQAERCSSTRSASGTR